MEINVGTESLDTRRTLGAIDEGRVLDIFRSLVEQYSPSWAEGPVLKVAIEALAAAGLAVKPVPPDPDAPERANLLVELGPQPSSLWLVGHLDTVPAPGSAPPRPRREDGKMYALGAADMKSGCAAMMEAVIAAHASGAALRRGVTVALVVGEEESGDGAKVIAPLIEGSPLVVVGEPTSLVPCLAHYSYVELRITTRGKRAHAALPDVGNSAIHAMLRVLDAMLRAAESSSEEVFVNVREIRGGNGMFIVVDHCEADVDIHISPKLDMAWVEEQILVAARRSAEEENTDLDVNVTLEGVGHVPAAREAYGALHDAFDRAGIEWAPSAFRSHSDVPILRGKGVPPVVCGPGALEVAHTRNEHVEESEVVAAARLYHALIQEVCG